MIRVLIVDDEPLIREGLVEMLDWEAMGCRVVGQGENGLEAVELIRNQSPDIVITDIMMPGMNGLELARYIADHHPDIKVIILTGYDDFAFAQEAIKIGVADFVLKPTKMDELIKTILSKKEAVLKERQKKRQDAELKQKLAESLPALRFKFFLDLSFGVIRDAGEIEGKADFLGINTVYHAVCSIEVDRYYELRQSHEEKDMVYYHFLMEEMVTRITEDLRLKMMLANQEERMMLILYTEAQCEASDFKERIDKAVQGIRKSIKEKLPFTVSVGVSRISGSLCEIRECFREAGQALKYKFYFGEDAVLHFSELNPFINRFFKGAGMTLQYTEAIRAGDADMTAVELEYMLKPLESCTDSAYIKSFCMSILMEAHRVYLESLDQDRDDNIGPGFSAFHQLLECDTRENAMKLVRETVLDFTRFIKERRGNQGNKLIAAILDFLEQHYAENLNLQDVADAFYLSQGHLSRMLKKGTGQTFLELLTQIRVEKAKDLLRNPRYKVYEVAEKVGFSDSRYFGQIFRKCVGLTPSEYKGE